MNPTIGAALIGAVIGGIVSLIGFWIQQRGVQQQLERQESMMREQTKDTERSVKMTAALEHKVDMLAKHLDQKLYSFDRTRDLINEFSEAFTTIELRWPGDEGERRHLEAVRKVSVIYMELFALVSEIGSPLMKEAMGEIEKIMSSPSWFKLVTLEGRIEEDFKKEFENITVNVKLDITIMHKELIKLREYITKGGES